MVLRHRFWKAVLILLSIIGTTSSQAESFSSHHSQEHASHCCGVCHIGHLSLLDAAHGFGFTPPSVLCWHDPAEQTTRLTESQVILRLSRAPPQ
jgi:hypothetical protein